MPVTVNNSPPIVGTSADVKPNGNAPGALFWESDTDTMYRFNGTTWNPVGNLAKILGSPTPVSESDLRSTMIQFLWRIWSELRELRRVTCSLTAGQTELFVETPDLPFNP